MAYVIAAPGMMTAAATDLATIGSDVSAAHTAATAPTIALVPAAADEVSASIAQVFSQHAQGYQALVGQAAAFHKQFVHNLTAGAGSYASVEATTASLLQSLNALPGEALSSIAMLELRALFGMTAADPQAEVFFGMLAALPPQQAIPALLIFPVSVPLEWLGFMLRNP